MMIQEFLGAADPVHQEIQSCGFAWTLSRKEPLNAATLREMARKLMISISDACLDAGAKDIGHVKAWIKHDEGFLYADTVGTPEDVTVEGSDGAPVDRIGITINAVICGLDRETVQQTTEKSAETALLHFGFKRAPHSEEEGA
jgi:hypothetical protein